MLNITPNHSIYAIAQNFSAGADLEFLYEGGGAPFGLYASLGAVLSVGSRAKPLVES